MRRLTILLLAAHLGGGAALAQSSAGYTLEESVFNQGGHPRQGAVLGSASFRVTIDSVGEGILGTGMSSASFAVDSGFVPAYRPPGEVTGVMLLGDHQTLEWNAERSAGTYNLYRDLLSALSTVDYGFCEQQELAGPTTTDPATPPAGDAYFYLVTVENRLQEEGPLGWNSAGEARPNASPCP